MELNKIQLTTKYKEHAIFLTWSNSAKKTLNSTQFHENCKSNRAHNKFSEDQSLLFIRDRISYANIIKLLQPEN